MFDNFDIDEPVVEEDLSLPAPRQMAECLGHDDVEAALLEMANGGRMPHALIFAGQEGVGKATMAFRLARYLLKHGKKEEESGLFGDALPTVTPANMTIAADDPVFRRVASGAHPDLLTIERLFDEKKSRYKGTVEVDEVRRIEPFLRLTASVQGGWRVVVVDDADTMNRNSQNAILKILEEPPERTVLILVTHRPGLLIPTIRSRCRVVSFVPPAKGVFSSLVRREHTDLANDDIDILYSIAGGSVGQGLRILQEGGLDAVSHIMALLYSWPNWDWVQIHALSETVNRPGQENALQSFQDVMLWITETVLKVKARGTVLEGALNNEAIQNLLDQYTLEEWIEICERLRSHFDMIQKANLDKRQAVLGAFSIFTLKKVA